jgi:hypothetical protein
MRLKLKRFSKQWWKELYEFIIVVFVLILLGAWFENIAKEVNIEKDSEKIWSSVCIIIGLIIIIIVGLSLFGII